MKNYNKGVALPQYAIIFGLISLALIPILIIFGQKINDAFASYTNSYKSMGAQTSKNSSDMIAVAQRSINNNPAQITTSPAAVQSNTPSTIATTASGSTSATTNNPVKQCVGTTCTIDFGDFILKGIPSDLNQLVQVSGASGGTDALSAMLEQIAEQLKNKGDTQGYTDYMNMSNLGHFVSSFQKTFESQAYSCSSQSDPAGCFYNYTNTTNFSTANITIPDNIKTLIPNIDTTTNFQKSIDFKYNYGILRETKTDYPNDYKKLITNTPEAAFINIYDKVMNNSKYSDSLKGVTQELYKEMTTIGDKQIWEVALTGDPNSKDLTTSEYYDPVTGKTLPFPATTSELTPDSILHPQTSLTTKLDSTLICASGGNSDDGTQCAKK